MIITAKIARPLIKSKKICRPFISVDSFWLLVKKYFRQEGEDTTAKLNINMNISSILDKSKQIIFRESEFFPCRLFGAVTNGQIAQRF